MARNDIGSNLESAQVFNVGKIWSAVIEEGVGLPEGRLGHAEELVYRLVDTDALGCLLLEIGDVGERLLREGSTATAGPVRSSITHWPCSGMQRPAWTIWVRG